MRTNAPLLRLSKAIIVLMMSSLLISNSEEVGHATESLTSYYVGTKRILSAGKTYALTQPITIGPGAELIVEQGANLVVLHDKPVFNLTGKVRLLGSRKEPIRILNAYVLFDKVGSYQTKSEVEMSHVIADNILGIFNDLEQGISVSIQDSNFRGRIVRPDERQLKLKQPLYSWLTFLQGFILERNSFENIPGFYLESFIHEPTLTVKDNLFIGNSSSYIDTGNAGDMKGHWFKVRSIDTFTGNSFMDLLGPVIKKVTHPGPIIAERNFRADGNFWGSSTLEVVRGWLDSDPATGALPQIDNILNEPSTYTPTEESHQIAFETSSFSKNFRLGKFPSANSKLTNRQKSTIRGWISGLPTTTKVNCLANSHASQGQKQTTIAERQAREVCSYIQTLVPIATVASTIQPVASRALASSIEVKINYFPVPGVRLDKPTPPKKATFQTAWLGSGSAITNPKPETQYSSKVNFCLANSSASGRQYLAIFRYPNGIYCKGATPFAQFSSIAALPENFEPREWRVVFEVFLSRFEGSMWVGTGHELSLTEFRYYTTNTLNPTPSLVATEWSSDFPSDGIYKSTIYRSWPPFDTYFAAGRIRLEFSGFRHQG